MEHIVAPQDSSLLSNTHLEPGGIQKEENRNNCTHQICWFHEYFSFWASERRKIFKNLHKKGQHMLIVKSTSLDNDI